MAKEGVKKARIASAKKAKSGKTCPICGEVTEQLLVIDPQTEGESTRFRRNFVQICKCNKSQYSL